MKRLDPFSKKIDVFHCYLQNEVFFLSVDLQSVDRVSGQVLATNPFYVLKRKTKSKHLKLILIVKCKFLTNLNTSDNLDFN